MRISDLSSDVFSSDRAAMSHASMTQTGRRGMTAAVIHPPHRHRAHHVLHPQPYPGIHRRDLGLHALPWRQSAAGVARAVDRLGEQRIGVLVLRLDDDVVGFGHRNAELVDRDQIGRATSELQSLMPIPYAVVCL